MKYLLLIHQGDSPTPRSPEAWATLSEDEQKAVFADYQPDTGCHPRSRTGRSGDGDDRSGPGRKNADHGRAVRRAQGGRRRLPGLRGR